MTTLVSLAVIVLAVDPVPEPNDVKAGWVAFAVFLGLAVAVAFLGRSLTKHLRRVRENVDAGLFGKGQEPSPTRTAADE